MHVCVFVERENEKEKRESEREQVKGFCYLNTISICCLLHLEPTQLSFFGLKTEYNQERSEIHQHSEPLSSLTLVCRSHLPPSKALCNYHVHGLLFFPPSTLTRRWTCHCRGPVTVPKALAQQELQC